MNQTVEAIFDGAVLRPDQPLKLAANTRVWVTVEPVVEINRPPRSFLRTARSLKLEGPPDWSTHLDHYLYGESPTHN
jgi:hypothetical protein